MQLLGVYIIIAMTFEGVLKNIFATGRDDDTIAHIRCSPLFSVHNIPFYLIILKKPAELRSKRDVDNSNMFEQSLVLCGKKCKK